MSATPRDGEAPPVPFDFAHTATASANRRAKAERLAHAALLAGFTTGTELLEDLTAPDEDAEHIRAALLRAAQVPRASEETWQVACAALQDLGAQRAAPGEQVRSCGAQAHPSTRVLLHDVVTVGERIVDGAACTHAPGTPPPPAPTVPPGWGDVGLDDGSEPDWAAIRAAVRVRVPVLS